MQSDQMSAVRSSHAESQEDDRYPRVGSIVWVRFPFLDEVRKRRVTAGIDEIEPGDKARPCIVLGAKRVAGRFHFDLVAGTTALSSQLRPTEFQVSSPADLAATGLARTTCFNTYGASRLVVPYTKDFFVKASGKDGYVSGRLPGALWTRLQECARQAERLSARRFVCEERDAGTRAFQR